MTSTSGIGLNSRLNELKGFAKPKRLVDPELVEKKFETFEKDFHRISELKGVNRPAAGYFLGLVDLAPAQSGNVDVVGIGSLRQTAQGCVIKMLRKGLYDSLAGYVTYEFDRAKNTVKATEVEHEQMQGYYLRPASTTSYTLDLNQQAVVDYLKSPGEPEVWNIAGEKRVAPSTSQPGSAASARAAQALPR